MAENRVLTLPEISATQLGSSNLGMQRWGGLNRLATGDVSISFLDPRTHAFHVVNLPRSDFDLMVRAAENLRRD